MVREAVSRGRLMLTGAASRAEPSATGPSKYLQIVHYCVQLAEVPRFEDGLETLTGELIQYRFDLSYAPAAK